MTVNLKSNLYVWPVNIFFLICETGVACMMRPLNYVVAQGMRLVVFHDRANKYDFVKTMPGKRRNHYQGDKSASWLLKSPTTPQLFSCSCVLHTYMHSYIQTYISGICMWVSYHNHWFFSQGHNSNNRACFAIASIVFLAATKQLNDWFSPSVCLSVCLWHLFDYVPIIVSSWNFQKLLPMTNVTSMQKVKVRSQRSRSQRSRPNLTVPGLWLQFEFTYMMMKLYI